VTRKHDFVRDYGATAHAAPRWRRWIRPAALIGLVALGWWTFGRIVDRPLALASSTVSVPAAGSTWSAADGDLGSTRRTTATPAMKAPPAWSVELGLAVVAPPVADDRNLYVALGFDRLVAVSVTDGSIEWTFLSSRISSAPVIAGGLLYLAQSSGGIVALDSATGDVRWQTRVDAPLIHSPAVADGVVIAYAENGVFGLDAINGRRLWSVDVEVSGPQMPPLVLDRYLAVATVEHVLIYERATGRETYRVPYWLAAGLAADDDRVFAVSGRVVASLDARSTQPWWENLRGLWTWLYLGSATGPPPPLTAWAVPARYDERRIFRPALTQDSLAVADDHGGVRLYRRDTGVLRWEVEAGRLAGSPTMTANGLLLVGEDALSLRSIENGAETSRVALPHADQRYVVVAGHGTYVIDESGSVRALRD
jgi:hypothetical protein